MIKLIAYLPIHLLFNMWLTHLAPRWVFKATYVPSSETVRKQEQAVRNKIQRHIYKVKK